MNGAATIGSLRVVLGADTAQFDKGLKDAQSRLAAFSAGVGKAAAGIGAALAAATAAVGVAVKSQIDRADELGKMSQKIGIPVEELSRLKHVADLSGLSLEQLATSVQRLSRNMVDAAGGKVNDLTRAMDALGISIKNSDGSLKTSQQVMQEVAARFERMRDGAGKTALAMAIFGRAGADMIPMLNQGADGVRKLMGEADQLGIVVDTKTAKAAENFNDNLTRMRAVIDGVFVQVASRLLPMMESLTNRLVDSAKGAQGLSTAVDALAGMLRTLVSAGVVVGSVFAALGQTVVGVTGAIINLVQGEFTKAWDSAKAAVFDAAGTMDSSIKLVGEIWRSASQQAGTAAEDMAAKIEPPVMRSKKALTDAAAEAKKFSDELDRVAKRVIKESETELQKFDRKMGDIQVSFMTGRISAEQYGQAVAKLRNDFSGVTEAMQQAHSAFGSAFADAITGAKSLSQALQGLLKDLARLLANLAFRQLLGTGKDGNWGLLGGLLPGFATGGSFVVGGAGGTDSQLVAFRATPGERVDVRTPGQVMAGGGATDVHVTVGWSRTADGNLKPFIEGISQRQAAAAVRQYDATMPDRFHQMALRGSRVR